MSVQVQERSGARRPVRVAMVIPRYHPIFGGAETQCRALVAALGARDDVEVPYVLTRRLHDDLPLDARVDGTRVRRIGRPGRSRWGEYGFYLRTAARLIAERRDYDVVHCHATSIVGFAVTVAARVARRPVVLKLSSTGELMSGLANYTDRIVLDRSVRGTLRRPLARFMGRHAHLVALNEQGREELALADARRPVVVPNGVDTSRFHAATPAVRAARRGSLGFAEDEFVLLYTGRFAAVKGIDVLLAALAELGSSGRLARVRLCLVGSGELQLEIAGRLQRLQDSPLAAQVTVCAPTDDVVPYLQAVDAFVFPSRREGMPNSVLEAIAAGLPCVLSDIAPHRELAGANPRARVWLFASGDAAAMTDAMSACVTTCRNTGPDAGALDQSFAIERVAERYAALYRSALDGPGPAPATAPVRAVTAPPSR
jgi:glycosyltransferase involved in cell wall biosynthesis